MTGISKEILEKYQVRKTKEQKTTFIEFMRAHFPEMKIEEGGFPKNRNIVIGDPDTAKVVFGAHYDTQAVMPVPNYLMPKNAFLSSLYACLISIPLFLVAFSLGKLLSVLVNNENLFSLFWMIILFGLLSLVLIGPANKHTVNDNTSGVITLIELMDSMTEEERAQSCFVFFDNEEKGLFGSAFFEKTHKEIMKEKPLVNFDCVSDGDYLMAVVKKKAFPEYSEKLAAAFADVTDKTMLVESTKDTRYPSDQKNFKKGIAVAAFNKSKRGLYLDKIHTPKDTVFDERNIEVLVKSFKNFLNLL